MNATKLKRLRAAGWKVGSTGDFLLSKFVERAARKEVLAQTAAALKARNQDLSYSQLQAIVDEALVRIRSQSGPRRQRR